MRDSPFLRFLGVAAVMALLIALLLPAVQHARPTAIQSQTVNFMKQQALALSNYENQHRAFPPAYVADAKGKPLLSWRVLILPEIEQVGLYNEFRLDEPWDSPHNQKLIPRMPFCYGSRRPDAPASGAEGKTPFLALRGPNSAVRNAVGVRRKDVRDGTSNTIAIVEVLPEYEVVWTKPDDLELDLPDVLDRLVTFRNCYALGMLSGDVTLADRDRLPLEKLRQMGDINDGALVKSWEGPNTERLWEALKQPD